MTPDSGQDTWLTAQGSENDLPLIFRARQHKPKGIDISCYPTLLNIYWPYDASIRNGMPPVDINEQQVKFENAIERIDDEAIAHLMLVITGNGRKEWIYYIQNPDSGVYIQHA
jgi:hypothetical protein